MKKISLILLGLLFLTHAPVFAIKTSADIKQLQEQDKKLKSELKNLLETNFSKTFINLNEKDKQVLSELMDKIYTFMDSTGSEDFPKLFKEYIYGDGNTITNYLFSQSASLKSIVSSNLNNTRKETQLADFSEKFNEKLNYVYKLAKDIRTWRDSTELCKNFVIFLIKDFFGAINKKIDADSRALISALNKAEKMEQDIEAAKKTKEQEAKERKEKEKAKQQEIEGPKERTIEPSKEETPKPSPTSPENLPAQPQAPNVTEKVIGKAKSDIAQLALQIKETARKITDAKYKSEFKAYADRLYSDRGDKDLTVFFEDLADAYIRQFKNINRNIERVGKKLEIVNGQYPTNIFTKGEIDNIIDWYRITATELNDIKELASGLKNKQVKEELLTLLRNANDKLNQIIKDFGFENIVKNDKIYILSNKK